MAVGSFFSLCSPDCPKQPRTSFPFYKFFYPIVSAKGPFIYYVITFLGFLDPPPPLRNHVFSTENNQKLAFSDPPLPPYK